MKISLSIRPAEHTALREWLTAELVGGKVTLAERLCLNSLLTRILGKLPPLPTDRYQVTPEGRRALRRYSRHHRD